MEQDHAVPSHVEKLARQLHWSAGTECLRREPAYAPRPWRGAGVARRNRCRRLAGLMLESLLREEGA